MNFFLINLAVVALLVFPAKPSFSDDKKSEQPKKSAAKLQKQFEDAKAAFRKGNLSEKDFWIKIVDLHLKSSQGQSFRPLLVEILQTEATLLKDANYPVLGAKLAAQAIKTSAKPTSKDMIPAWNLLSDVAEERPIFDLLIDTASSLGETTGLPPVFEEDWYYFLGETMSKEGDFEKAIAYFKKIPSDNYYYLAANYELSMEYLNQDQLDKALESLQKVLDHTTSKDRILSYKVSNQYRDYANMAIARIEYERKNFFKSVQFFRKIPNSSFLFYDSQFEQAWSLFMAGYPNHALGALHGATSPFFSQKYNPEVSILRSFIYYWICSYDDSKSALADFIQNYSETVNGINGFLEKKNLNPETAYELFENVVTGVSENTLGISRQLLDTVASNDRMFFVRDQLAAIADEKNRFEKHGLFGYDRGTKAFNRIFLSWINTSKTEVGKTFMEELQSLRDFYAQLRFQANFLYIELIMSEKDQLMGKGQLDSAKLIDAKMSNKVKGWSAHPMPWTESDKGEYWWDEIGFYVYQVKPKCNAYDVPVEKTGAKKNEK